MRSIGQFLPVLNKWSSHRTAAIFEGPARLCTRFYSETHKASQPKFTHLSSGGQSGSPLYPTMVDVSGKEVTNRTAHARGIVSLLHKGDISTPKGPVFATAVVAGTMAVKKTHDLIPFCHPLAIESCKINIQLLDCQSAASTPSETSPCFSPQPSSSFDSSPSPSPSSPSSPSPSSSSSSAFAQVDCTVSVHHKTGVEMEALTGVSVACLCVYDMCKSISHDMTIESVRLISKTGGKSDVKLGKA